MELTNNTVLRGYLTHIRSNVRKMASLRFEYQEHPDSDGPPPESEASTRMRKQWESLRSDLFKVLGVKILQWNQLTGQAKLVQQSGAGMGDPLRITLGALKTRADKARRKDPTIKLLESWNKAAKEAR